LGGLAARCTRGKAQRERRDDVSPSCNIKHRLRYRRNIFPRQCTEARSNSVILLPSRDQQRLKLMLLDQRERRRVNPAVPFPFPLPLSCRSCDVHQPAEFRKLGSSTEARAYFRISILGR